MSAAWYEWTCQNTNCGAVMVTLGPMPEDGLCSSCRAMADEAFRVVELPSDADGDEYKLSRTD